MQADDPLEVLWAHVAGNWESPPTHDAFIEAARAATRLEFAAKRYRQEADQETRREVSEAHLKRIAAIALADLEAARVHRAMEREGRRSALRLLIGALVLSIVLVGAYASFGSH